MEVMKKGRYLMRVNLMNQEIAKHFACCNMRNLSFPHKVYIYASFHFLKQQLTTVYYYEMTNIYLYTNMK
jgi:hypothetical protein